MEDEAIKKPLPAPKSKPTTEVICEYCNAGAIVDSSKSWVCHECRKWNQLINDDKTSAKPKEPKKDKSWLS